MWPPPYGRWENPLAVFRSLNNKNSESIFEESIDLSILISEYLSELERLATLTTDLVKPHERLVLVSFTHYCASTSSLSNSWSRSALQGTEVPGRSRLEAGFPLRCFQRLSDPNVATRLCCWRNNRSTIGSSIPVLSY